MTRKREAQVDDIRMKISELDHAIYDIVNSLEEDIDGLMCLYGNLRTRIQAVEACCDRHSLNKDNPSPCAAWVDSDEADDGCEVQ